MSVSPQHRRAGFGANLPRSSLVVVPAGGAQVSSWREAKMIEVPSAASPRIQVLPQPRGQNRSRRGKKTREKFIGAFQVVARGRNAGCIPRYHWSLSGA